MFKRKSTYLIISLAALVLVLAGVIILQRQSAGSPSSPALADNPAVKLGITYLPVTKSVSAYYALGLDSGALVTEVSAGGLAEKAGIKVGDVITCFNGSQIGAETSLLGMMRSCAAGDGLNVEFNNNGCCRTVQITDSASTPY